MEATKKLDKTLDGVMTDFANDLSDELALLLPFERQMVVLSVAQTILMLEHYGEDKEALMKGVRKVAHTLERMALEGFAKK